MLETSEQTDKLDEAIAKAQGEIEPAAKDRTNPAFRSKYADLSSVWAACRSALATHGVSVTQWPLHSEDGRLHLVTRIAHAGQWMRATFSVPVDKANAHGYGSAMTYAKRYSLAACLGVVAEDDDDGNKASAPQPIDLKAKAEAQHQAYTALKAAVDAGDALGVWAVRIGDETAYRAAHSLLDTKGKKAAKELEIKAPDLIKEYAEKLDDHADLDEDLGVEQIWGELSKPGKLLVWAELEDKTKTFIKQLKKEAA